MGFFFFFFPAMCCLHAQLVKESNLPLEERCCYAGMAHAASPLRRAGPVESQLGALLDKAFRTPKKDK